MWNLRSHTLVFWTNLNESLYNFKYVKEKSLALTIDKSGSVGVWRDLEPLETKPLGVTLEEKLVVNETEMDYIVDEQSRSNIRERKNEQSMILEEREPEKVSTTKAEPEKNLLEKQTVPKTSNLREESEEITTKKSTKYIKSKVDMIIDCYPQDTLYPSSTSLFKNRKFLTWNVMASISLR